MDNKDRVLQACLSNPTKKPGRHWVAAETGLAPATVGRWLSILRSEGALEGREPGDPINDIKQEIEHPLLPDDLPTAEELLERRKKEFARKSAAKEARKLIPVKVNIPGPIGILHMGDPHVDDAGTDIEALERHVRLIHDTEGLYGANVGDMQNNWIGRLSGLYGKQETTAAQAWVLVEWLIESVQWIYLVGGNHDCLDTETEVWTRQGWKTHDQVTEDDIVFSLNPDGTGDWSEINEVVRFPFDGELNYTSNVRFDLACTDNHRVYHTSRMKDEIQVKEFSDLPDRVLVPQAAKGSGGGIGLSDDEIRLAAWFLTDGGFKDKARGSVQLYQSKPKGIAQIRGLLKRLGIAYTETVRNRDIQIVAGRALVKKPLPQYSFYIKAGDYGHIFECKGRLPHWAWFMSDDQFMVFLEAVIAGDGSWYTKSDNAILYGEERFLSEMQALCCMHGWSATVVQSNRGDFRLNICHRQKVNLVKSTMTEKRPYRGIVWCLRVPNGNFLVRRNGKAHFTGNSWHTNGSQKSPGDPLQWMINQGRGGLYEPNGARLGLQFPNGKEVRINARHDFKGHSQWNTVHGPSKAAQMGWRDHILTCGHLHISGYTFVKCPATGLISHVLRVAGYKIYDDYASEKGLPNQNISPAFVTVIDPTKDDDDPDLVTTFFSPEKGADYLTYLRSK